jgi:hypothetical protein
MNRTDSPALAWADVQGPLQGNGAAGEGAVISSENARGWQAILSGRLAEWERDPGRLDDDGVEAPSRETIERAAAVARNLCAAGLPAPHRVAATGDGGVVFARQDGPLFSNIEVTGEGVVELTVFQDARLVSRQRLN